MKFLSSFFSRHSAPFALLLAKLFARKVVLAAALVLLLVLGVAVFVPWLSAADPNSITVTERLFAPSWAHWAGTDELGRDVLLRIVHGARYSLLIGFVTAAGAVVLGTLMGVLAGFFRRLDAPLMRLVDAMMSLLRELLFVDAARALGVRTPRILWAHILPNLMSPVLVQVTFIFAYAILAEAGLSFLGVGVPPDIPTWGTMIAGSLEYSDRAFWTILFPGLAIVLTAVSLQMLGDGVRDLLDPKLKKAV